VKLWISKFLLFLPILLGFYWQGCTENKQRHLLPVEHIVMASIIDKNKAIEISNKDASLVYRDLTPYHIAAQLKDNNWIVDYELNDARAVGGGPHYIISGKTGEILSYRYEQ
jgi:hypothetical protein